MNYNLIDRFIEVGFKLKKDECTTNSSEVADTLSSFKHGRVKEYKYYPEYFTNKHYTLVVFSYDAMIMRLNVERMAKMVKTDYRLYIHNNIDGSYNDSIFQMSYDNDWNIEYIDEKLKEIFSKELVSKKRENILSELI